MTANSGAGLDCRDTLIERVDKSSDLIERSTGLKGEADAHSVRSVVALWQDGRPAVSERSSIRFAEIDEEAGSPDAS